MYKMSGIRLNKIISLVLGADAEGIRIKKRKGKEKGLRIYLLHIAVVTADIKKRI